MKHKCPTCGRLNAIVNECHCDPNNLPTRVPNPHAHTPGPWHWHDCFGRKDGVGPTLCGRNILNEEPPMGQCSHFSFAVSDSHGFCVAHCTGALVTCSSDWSEANARLMAAAPQLLDTMKALRDAVLKAGMERGRKLDGSYLPTFGPEGRFDTEELVALEEARLLVAAIEWRIETRTRLGTQNS